MKKQNYFLIVYIIMQTVMIGFLLYAFRHPEGNFPWSLSTTYTIYIVYLLVMFFSLIAFIVLTIREKKKKEKQ